ncbi:hypothetical protein [Hymenobacter guriensis]|uniref:DUF3293 domain-containing protein n=1 Tax=Hymenobacter guriensis TaxID=2793065 RepID=A0ABS0L7X4_9BACT|nr:hypothetical protein [Hymenobacter guriensis]MBG8556161.1 hypothetical protein [Hymenobacter guriensis]
MTCQPAPLPIASPRLAQRPVHTLLDAFAAGLPWLSNAYGLVQTGQRVVNKKAERFPQLYLQDGSGKHADLRPDEKQATLSFFERNGPDSFDWDEGAEGIAGKWSHPLAMVLWANLPRIDNRGYDYSDELMADAMRVLTDTLPDAEVLTVERRPEEVFRRYGWEVAQHQLLMYPYAAARIVFIAHTPGLIDCTGPFTVQVGPTACPPDLRP